MCLLPKPYNQITILKQGGDLCACAPERWCRCLRSLLRIPPAETEHPLQASTGFRLITCLSVGLDKHVGSCE